MLVSAADKLHNLRAIYSDFGEIGDAIFQRFSAPDPKREHVLWYDASLRDVYVSADSVSDQRRNRLAVGLTELLTKLGDRDSEFVPNA